MRDAHSSRSTNDTPAADFISTVGSGSIFLLLVLVGGLGLFACSNDDDTGGDAGHDAALDAETDAITDASPGDGGGDTDITGNVFLLNGPSFAGEAASINGFTVDTTSTSTINASVSAIQSNSKEVITEEPTGSYEVTITIDTTNHRPIDPLYFGFNLNAKTLRRSYSDTQLDTLDDDRFSTLLSKLRPGLISYKGGRFDYTYWDRYNTRVGPFDPPSGYEYVLKASDLTRLSNIISSAGAHLYLNPDFNPDHESDWADAFTYIQENNLSVDHAALVNCELAPTDYGGGTQAVNTYVDLFVDYYTALKAVDPNLIIGAPHGAQNLLNDGLTEQILIALSPSYQIDLIATHAYQLGGYNTYFPENETSFDNLLVLSPTGTPDTVGNQIYETLTVHAVQLRDQYYPNAKVIWGEFGATLTTGDELDDQVMKSIATALWTADVLGRSARAGADAMLYYNLTHMQGWTWPSMLFTNNFAEIYPVFYAYLMFGQWWGDSWVTSVSSTNEQDVRINAATDSDYVYVMLINTTRQSDITTKVEITHNGVTYYLDFNASDPLPAHSITLVYFDPA